MQHTSPHQEQKPPQLRKAAWSAFLNQHLAQQQGSAATAVDTNEFSCTASQCNAYLRMYTVVDCHRALVNWGKALVGRAELAADRGAASKLYNAAIDKFEAVLEEDPEMLVAKYRCALAMQVRHAVMSR